MKDYDPSIVPNMDDNSKENFDKTTAFIEYLAEKAKKEKNK